METPASPTRGQIVCTIFLYSAASSCSVSLCPDSTIFMTSGFLAINDGFVVCPSTKPISCLICAVSSGSPPSTRIFECGRFGGVVVSPTVWLELPIRVSLLSLAQDFDDCCRKGSINAQLSPNSSNRQIHQF